MIGRLSRSIWLRTSVLGFLCIFFYIVFYPRGDARPGPGLIVSDYTRIEPNSSIPSENRIVVSVKTGASEASDRIPTQMQTCLRDVEHVVFFSDLEQDVGEYHLHDSLDTISWTVSDGNPDFDFYFTQKELWGTSHNISSLKGTKNSKSPKELAAWTLDKYKNIHILEKTWALKPDMDWYLFIDADTYLVWKNMHRWLATLNPNNKYYFGSEVSLSHTRFAHGGSGIVLSRAAMYELAVVNKGTAASWDPKIHGECCGDFVLAQALEKMGILLQDVWPLMSGEAPSTMPFGPGTPDYWCRPALTMHHLNPGEMRTFTEWEDRRGNKSELVTHTEIFEEFLLEYLPAEREDWDNLSSERGEFGKTGGVTSEAMTYLDCARACEADEKCFQYSHHGHTCNFGMSARLGYEKASDEEGMWRSGWNKARLSEWASQQPPCVHLEFPKQDEGK